MPPHVSHLGIDRLGAPHRRHMRVNPPGRRLLLVLGAGERAAAAGGAGNVHGETPSALLLLQWRGSGGRRWRGGGRRSVSRRGWLALPPGRWVRALQQAEFLHLVDNLPAKGKGGSEQLKQMESNTKGMREH